MVSEKAGLTLFFPLFLVLIGVEIDGLQTQVAQQYIEGVK